jgi:hypothetical protein
MYIVKKEKRSPEDPAPEEIRPPSDLEADPSKKGPQGLF